MRDGLLCQLGDGSVFAAPRAAPRHLQPRLRGLPSSHPDTWADPVPPPVGALAGDGAGGGEPERSPVGRLLAENAPPPSGLEWDRATPRVARIVGRPRGLALTPAGLVSRPCPTEGISVATYEVWFDGRIERGEGPR